MEYLRWIESNPEVAIAFLTICIAPFVGGFARRLFPHKEPIAIKREEVTPELREAISEMSANLRSIRSDIRDMQFEVKTLRIAVDGAMRE